MQTSSLHPGTILNSPTQQYRIVEALGAGSFGITYLATSKVKHGNVTFTVKFAIKEHFMESCFRDDNGVLVHCTPASQKNVEQSRKDFITEARRLQQICQYSRNIVHVNEAFEANGTAYYVMEYLDGGSPKQTDERTALRIIQQVAEAVSILHKNKLLHLDIKPDNIVLNSSENGDTYPVLIDFGITKHFDEKGNPTSSPNAKGVSQGYAPIEQNDVIREFAPTLDIYALGATLLYLLTGKNPPSSVKLIDPSQRELKKLIPTQVSSSTRNAILKAMNPNKNDRTQSVESLLKDLKISGSNQSNIPNHQKVDTKPIDSKPKSNTIPLEKNDDEKKTSDTTIKWNVSHWVTLISLIAAIAGFGVIYDNILLTAFNCVLGSIAGFFLSAAISQKAKIKWRLTISLIFFILLIVCVCIHAYTPIFVLLTEIILFIVLLSTAVSDNNLWRWLLSTLFIFIAGFFGYVWYSENILHDMDIESSDSNIIEQNEITDSEIYCDASEMQNINEHDYVDLGLPSGLKWATHNIGDNVVFGDRYAYNELIKCHETSKRSSKDYLRRNHVVDSTLNLMSEFDVVTSQWGAPWRTPTIEEVRELFDNCKNIIEEVPTPGLRLIGPNGASIFLPTHIVGRMFAFDYLSSTAIDYDGKKWYGVCFKDSMYEMLPFNPNDKGLIRPVFN